ncbi:hypothetical protein ACJX0J_030610, partial [Zea mays]
MYFLDEKLHKLNKDGKHFTMLRFNNIQGDLKEYELWIYTLEKASDLYQIYSM